MEKLTPVQCLDSALVKCITIYLAIGCLLHHSPNCLPRIFSTASFSRRSRSKL
jgi:hypothetical protein